MKKSYLSHFDKGDTSTLWAGWVKMVALCTSLVMLSLAPALAVEVDDGGSVSAEIVEIYTLSPDSGEAVIKFSGPVMTDFGYVLSVSDFIYNDGAGAGSGGAMAISAMGADADASDGRVTVLVNSAFTDGDLAEDSISAAPTIYDEGGNFLPSTPVLIEEKALSGGLVEIAFMANPDAYVGLAQPLVEYEFSAQNGSVDVSSITVSVSGEALSSMSNLTLVDGEGLPLASNPGVIAPGDLTFVLSEGAPIESGSIGFFALIADVAESAADLSFLIELDTATGVVLGEGVDNGGDAGVLAHSLTFFAEDDGSVLDLPVVDGLLAEVSVLDAETGVFLGSVDMNTETSFRIDIFSFVAIADQVNGFDRIIVDLPTDFAAPSDVSLSEYRLTEEGLVLEADLESSSVFESPNKLKVSLASVLKNETNDRIYRLSFVSTTFDYPDAAYFDVAVDNSQASDVVFAVAEDVNGDDLSGRLEIDVLQQELTDEEFENFFTAVADEVTLEVDYDVITTGDTAVPFDVYIRARNIVGHRGFNLLKLGLLWDFSNILNVDVSLFDSELDDYESLAVDSGLSSLSTITDDPSYGNLVRVEFNGLLGVDEAGVSEDVLLKVSFVADMPNRVTSGYISAELDDKSKSFPSFADYGNVTNVTDFDDGVVYVEPNISDLDFNAQLLSSLVFEVNSGNALVSDNLSGQPVAGKSSYVDVLFKAEKSSLDKGFDFAEVYTEFPIDGNQVNTDDVEFFSAPEQGFLLGANVLEEISSGITVAKSDSSITLSFDDGVISLDESQIFRVRIPVTAPDFSGPYAFDLRLASSLAPGIDAFADIGDVVPGLGLNDDQVNVRPFVDEDAFRSGSVQPPLEFVESELYPNFAPSASSETFTIAANLTYDADLNEGYNQFQVLLPPGYGAPGSVSLTVGALGAGALQPSAYSSDASEGELLITLTQSDLIAESSNLIISFSATTPKVPKFGTFELWVSNSATPLLAAPAAWADLSYGEGDGSMGVDVYPDFSTITTFGLPVEELVAEAIVASLLGTMPRADETVRVSIFAETVADASNEGFDLLTLDLPSAFGDFPTKLVSANVNGNLLLEGTSSGYDLDRADLSAPSLEFKTTYKSASIQLVFDIQAPEDADLYFINVSVDNQAIPNVVDADFGIDDLNGNDNDENSLFFNIFPPEIVVDDAFYVVDDLIAEITNLDDLVVNEGAKVTLAVNAMSLTSSANGFNRLLVKKDESITFSSVDSLTRVSSTGSETLIKDIDYSVEPQDDVIRIKFDEAQVSGISEALFTLVFNINAPDVPDEFRFGVSVDNSNLRRPVYAIDGDANGVDSDRNNMFINVNPDFKAGDVIAASLAGLEAELVVVDGNAFGKRAEAGSSNTLRVYVLPDFLEDNTGINNFSLFLPRSFGKPSNVKVFVTDESDLTSQEELVKGNVDFAADIGDDNRIDVDFSGAQRDTWKTIDFESTSGGSNLFIVEFTSTLPQKPNVYEMKVEAVNKSAPIPARAFFADLNGTLDDDGDGLNDGLLDNSLTLLVVPKAVAADVFAARQNAESATSEILYPSNGTLGSTVEMALATNVIVGAGNIDTLVIELPGEFSNVTGMVVSKTLDNESSSIRLTEVTDYSLDTSDVESLSIVFTEGFTDNVLVETTFNVTLPSRSTDFEFSVAVDNSGEPKELDAISGDAKVGEGFDELLFFVDPAEFTDEDLTKTMLTDLKSNVTYPSAVEVGVTSAVNMTIESSVSGEDLGLDIIDIFSEGLSSLSDLEIKAKVNDGLSQTIFSGIDYKVVYHDEGATIIFTETYSSNVTLELAFNATADSDPGVGYFSVTAASKLLPLQFPAAVSDVVGATMDVVIQPAAKSAAELVERPARPVEELLFDVTPRRVDASTSQVFEVYVSSFSTNLVTEIDSGDGIEKIPANSGFDQLTVNLSKSFASVGQFEIYKFESGFSGSNTLLQPFSDYSYEINGNNRVVFKFLNGFEGLDGETSLKVHFSSTMPTQPKSTNVKVFVDNSSKSNRVKGSEADLNEDSTANKKIVVLPVFDPDAQIARVGSEAVATVVYPLHESGNIDYPEANQVASYAYDLRLAFNAIQGDVGFDTIKVQMPKKFKNVALASVQVSRDGASVVALPISSDGVTSEYDADEKALTLSFGSVQGVLGSGNELQYLDLGLSVSVGRVKGQRRHSLTLINASEGVSLSVKKGYVLGNVVDPGETGKLAVRVQGSNPASSKSGLFGDAADALVSEFLADVRVWEETTSTFDANIQFSGNARNVWVRTEPTVAEGEPGFDFIQIDLPYGAGTPSNVVVFFRSPSGNIVYLEEFRDYQVETDDGALAIEFEEAMLVDAGLMSDGLDGVFAQKLGLNVEASELSVIFDMVMPTRVGTHFFDAWLANASSSFEAYYADPFVGNRSYSRTSVAWNAQGDGSKFMKIQQLADGVTSAGSFESSFVLADASVNGSEITADTTRRLRMDGVFTPSGTASDLALDILLPEGFSSVSDVVITKDNETLIEFIDYEIDLDASRAFGITLLDDVVSSKATVRGKALSAGESSSVEYSVSFDIQTPDEIPDDIDTISFTPSVFVSAGGDGSTPPSIDFGVPPEGGSSEGFTLNTLSVISLALGLDQPTLSSGVAADLTLTGPSGVVYENKLPIDEGAKSASLVWANALVDGSAVAWPDGDYALEIRISQYQTVEQTFSISNASVDLFVSVESEPLQVALALDPAFIDNDLSGESVNLVYFLSLTSGNTLGDLTLEIPADLVYTVSGISIDGEVLSSGQWSLDGTTLSANLNGRTPSANVVVMGSVNTGSAQSDFQFESTLTTSTGFSVEAMDVLDAKSVPTLSVGKFVRLASAELPTGLVGINYSYDFSSLVSFDESQISFLTYSVVWTDDKSPGFSMTTGGVLSGQPTESEVYSANVTVTGSEGGEAFTANHVYELEIKSAPLELYSFSPIAVPSEGGSVVLMGQGFESDAIVTINGESVDYDFVSASEIVLTVPVLDIDSYSITITDKDEEVFLPNALNGSSLIVHSGSSTSIDMEVTVEGDPDVMDYDMVGIQGFYQGGFRSLIEDAFGDYDAQGGEDYRIYYYNESHQELGSLDASNISEVRAGEGFWRISNIAGAVAFDGVNPAEVHSYDVTVSPNNWKLISNVYGDVVSWSDVSVLTGEPGSATAVTMSEAISEGLVSSLYKMDKESSDVARPYELASELESGVAYWIKNETNAAITFKISRPEGESSSSEVLLKPDGDLPPEAPVTYQKAASVSGGGSSAGGGGGCLLR